ncbi:MAG: ABC transporter ATP-binding protein [Eubacterium sp.]|nr:ABC transporter ATP-binding protein [Eubacterium sp.]
MKELLKVEKLRVTDTRNGEVIVDDLSFSLGENRCLGIVGESGSGKSMTARALLGLNKAWLKAEGRALFQMASGETDLLAQDPKELARLRGSDIGLIVQDAMSAFDPIERLGRQMAETLGAKLGLGKKEALEQAAQDLAALNIEDPRGLMAKYPHQLSGGMLQRVMIALALVMQPKIIIADEPTTALDAVNQRQVVTLFEALREKTGTSLIFISHDLGVVRRLADDLLVMQAGRAVEAGEAREIFGHPASDYTRYLIETRLEITNSLKIALGGAQHEKSH